MRRFCFPSSWCVVARRSWPPSPRPARARAPFGSPDDGAPSGRVATFAAGLLVVSPLAIRVAPDRTRRSPLVRFCFPAAYAGRAVLVRGRQPPDHPASAFPLDRRQLPVVAGFVRAPAVFTSRRRAELPIPGRFAIRDVSASPRGSFVHGFLCTVHVLRYGPAAGRCRGLAGARAVHHDAPIRQRSWGSIVLAALRSLDPATRSV